MTLQHSTCYTTKPFNIYREIQFSNMCAQVKRRFRMKKSISHKDLRTQDS